MKKLIADMIAFQNEARSNGEWPGEKLVEGQKPEVLLVTCSDSRVVPHLATRSGPGRIFVVRNAGNMLPDEGTGSSEEATIEYGIRALGIPSLVVCGHTHCGAMKGLLGNVDSMPAVRRWLRAGRDTLERVRAKQEAGVDPETIVVEENVLAQLERARSYPVVAEALKKGALELHGCVFDIKTAAFTRWNESMGRFVPLTEEASRAA